MTASMVPWSLCRMVTATSQVRCWAPPIPRCRTEFPKELGFACTDRGRRFPVFVSAARPRTNGQTKKGQLALAPGFCCDRPDPDDPGGLGLQESEAEGTGPTQCFLLSIQAGRRLAEVGRYYEFG